MGITVTPYSEGASLERNRIDYPLNLADLGAHPLLALAVKETRPARSVKVEWIVHTPSGPELWANYTQIVRTPFTETDETSLGVAFTRHLDAIEKTLWDGIPSHGLGKSPPIHFCGGVRHFLGRDAVVGDQVRYRPLRETILLKNRGAANLHEFLTEFTLEVTPTRPLV